MHLVHNWSSGIPHFPIGPGVSLNRDRSFSVPQFHVELPCQKIITQIGTRIANYKIGTEKMRESVSTTYVEAAKEALNFVYLLRWLCLHIKSTYSRLSRYYVVQARGGIFNMGGPRDQVEHTYTYKYQVIFTWVYSRLPSAILFISTACKLLFE